MRKLAVSLTLVVGAIAAGASQSSATPVETGCASSNEYRSVEQWVDMGYTNAPVFLDATGNNDGYVCGLALPKGYTWGRFVKALGITPHNDVIYLFGDNGSPAKQD